MITIENEESQNTRHRSLLVETGLVADLPENAQLLLFQGQCLAIVWLSSISSASFSARKEDVMLGRSCPSNLCRARI